MLQISVILNADLHGILASDLKKIKIYPALRRMFVAYIRQTVENCVTVILSFFRIVLFCIIV